MMQEWLRVVAVGRKNPILCQQNLLEWCYSEAPSLTHMHHMHYCSVSAACLTAAGASHPVVGEVHGTDTQTHRDRERCADMHV